METSIYMVTFFSILRMEISKASFSCPPSAPTISLVDSCPRNKTEWDHAAQRKKCGMMAAHQNCTDAAKFQYHCLLNHHRNATLEVCAPIFYLQGFCASYDTDKIDIVENYEPGFECLKFSGGYRCPPRYPSSEAYKYLPCYGSQIGTKTTTSTTTQETATTVTTTNDEENAVYIPVIVALAIIVIALCSFILMFTLKRKFGWPSRDCFRRRFRRRPKRANDAEYQPDERKEEKSLLKANDAEYQSDDGKEEKQDRLLEDSQKEKGDKEQKIGKLKDLLRYPVHILKRELDLKDLKEKIVIYSKSIKAHFTAPLISNLRSVQSSDDYGRLDMTIVFTLLQNFCENIKPPSKGWGYEPPSDEVTTGADIERIRLMWNKFCDDDLQFSQLDDVYNRMKDKYGTEAVLGDDGVQKYGEEDGFEEMKEKIPSNRMAPDCIKENGIIMTDNITSAILSLQTRNVVILRGAIGCGKTSALEAIQNHYRKEGFKAVWQEEYEHKTWKSFTEKTIVLCDNLFGRFGCHTFSKQDILSIENCLESIENESKGNNKVVVGIHHHVFEEIKKTCTLNFLQNKNTTVDMDKLSTAEKLLIFKLQQKEGHCKTDPECWFGKIEFSSVFTKLSLSPGNVGSPFLTLMYCHHHELFFGDDFTKNPVQSLMKHFQKMRMGSHTDYSCLVYLMVVQSHTFDEKLPTWAGHFDALITMDALIKLCKQRFGYIQNGLKNARLIHDVLTIVLFKCAAELNEDFLPVVQNSNETVLLELMRPPGDTFCEFYTSLAKVKRNEEFREVGKVLVNRLVHHWNKYWEHPLQSTTIFKKARAKLQQQQN